MFLSHVLVPLITEAQKKPPRDKTLVESVREAVFGSEFRAQIVWDQYMQAIICSSDGHSEPLCVHALKDRSNYALF